MKVYLAIGQFCWGRGATLQAAKRIAKANGSPFKDGFAVYETEAEEEKSVFMDEMGYIHGDQALIHVAGPDLLLVK